MARVTAEIAPGEVSQAQWDAKYETTTKALKDLGGTDAKDTDDLPEGTASKYDTGAPPVTTDELTEGATNKYDTGAPPTDLDGVPDSTTRKAMSDTEKTKLTGVEDDATADQSGAEIQTAVKELTDADREIMISEPLTGEHRVYGAHRNVAGNLEYEYDETPVL